MRRFAIVVAAENENIDNEMRGQHVHPEGSKRRAEQWHTQTLVCAGERFHRLPDNGMLPRAPERPRAPASSPSYPKRHPRFGLLLMDSSQLDRDSPYPIPSLLALSRSSAIIYNSNTNL